MQPGDASGSSRSPLDGRGRVCARRTARQVLEGLPEEAEEEISEEEPDSDED